MLIYVVKIIENVSIIGFRQLSCNMEGFFRLRNTDYETEIKKDELILDFSMID
jgi:hypothetical protein